jgi:hypothetical protein
MQALQAISLLDLEHVTGGCPPGSRCIHVPAQLPAAPGVQAPVPAQLPTATRPTQLQQPIAGVPAFNIFRPGIR